MNLNATRITALMVAAMLVACGAPQRPQQVCPVAAQPELTRVASRATPDGRVIADWMIGSDPDSVLGPGDSVGHLIREIWFRFAADPNTPLRYPAVLSIEPDKWTFDIFSPDGRYVVLLQPTGDIHLVPVDQLHAYAKDPRAPHEVITGKHRPDDPAVFFEEPRWTSATTFEVTAICCGTYWQVTHRIGSKTEHGEVHGLRN